MSKKKRDVLGVLSTQIGPHGAESWLADYVHGSVRTVSSNLYRDEFPKLDQVTPVRPCNFPVIGSSRVSRAFRKLSKARLDAS